MNKLMKTLRSRAGMTLLELVVSAALIGIASTIVTTVLVTASKTSAYTARFDREARGVASYLNGDETVDGVSSANLTGRALRVRLGDGSTISIPISHHIASSDGTGVSFRYFLPEERE